VARGEGENTSTKKKNSTCPRTGSQPACNGRGEEKDRVGKSPIVKGVLKNSSKQKWKRDKKEFCLTKRRICTFSAQKKK